MQNVYVLWFYRNTTNGHTHRQSSRQVHKQSNMHTNSNKTSTQTNIQTIKQSNRQASKHRLHICVWVFVCLTDKHPNVWEQCMFSYIAVGEKKCAHRQLHRQVQWHTCNEKQMVSAGTCLLYLPPQIPKTRTQNPQTVVSTLIQLSPHTRTTTQRHQTVFYLVEHNSLVV